MPSIDITGWKLNRGQRTELLQQFPPRYPNVVADHVTLKYAGDGPTPLPEATVGEIVGHADDGSGVECMVVRIDGTTDRPDGGILHITWSLAEGREAKESNDLLAAQDWELIELPMPVQLAPAQWQR